MRVAVICLTLLVVPGLSNGYTIRLQPAKSSAVEVAGIDATNLEALSQAGWQSEQWNKLLALKPLRGTPDEQRQRLAMLGSYRVSKDALVFEPRFPLQPNVPYQAVFDPAALPVPQERDMVRQRLEIRAAVPPAATVVSQVFPTRRQLPENLLKFYIHFSAPMSQGGIYRHIKLLDDNDKPVEGAFLELGEELWNPDGTRLTLYFDPGRIKQGLKPREELGPALENGKKYALVIDSQWTDANDRPLKTSFRKAFTVGESMDKCAPIEKWKIAAGQAGTRQPVEVAFPAPLDSALLQRLVWIADSSGKKIAGTVSLDRAETVWRFTPTEPWLAGEYQLSADNRLEDLAGNSLAKPFEVDELRPIQREIKPEVLKRKFLIK